ncbi:unnamed protein product [Toxocara canis]|uniref:Protein kinase domain-containing protein n=1 Tax=Toxocara canis TaxID=6265 RepID=A0A183VHC7_TOXCA|nr:unnamed protein product [Toxocara canis]
MASSYQMISQAFYFRCAILFCFNYPTAALAQYRLIAQLCASDDKELTGKLACNEANLNVITHLGIYKRKMTVQESLAHPYLAEYSVPENEPVVRGPMTVQESLAHPFFAEYSVPENEPVVRGPCVIKECNECHRILTE